ncbi:MAG: hypothetical protein HOE90_12285 [Bacteriovoracaceae bacterium]|jgi:hypothetical protein|nr:hypothetical protein [Bacteriovoracaceae bacterium]
MKLVILMMPLLLIFTSCSSFLVTRDDTVLPPERKVARRKAMAHSMYVRSVYKGRGISANSQDELFLRLDQNCSYLYEGKLLKRTMKTFKKKGVAHAIGVCMSDKIEDEPTGQQKKINIYSKFRITTDDEFGPLYESKMKEILKRKCSIRYNGRMNRASYMIKQHSKYEFYLLGSCQLPSQSRQVSSFDTPFADQPL